MSVWLRLFTGRSHRTSAGLAKHRPKQQPARRLSETARATRNVAPATAFLDPDGPDSGALLSVPVMLSEPAPRPPLPYREWLDHHVLRKRWVVWIVALYFHWIVILLLAILIVQAPERFEEIMLNAAFSAPEDLPAELLPTMELEPEPENPEAAREVLTAAPAPLESWLPEDLSSQSLTAAATDVLPDAIRQLALAAESGESRDTSASPAESTFGPPTPASAVSAGSFSVWTEPENPDPGEPYRIVIQVRIPQGTAEYNVSDLEGVVVGSDGYRKPIPGSLRGALPIVSGHVRLTIPVVSADQEVEDTIFIRSGMLREAQKLTIRF